MKPGALGLIALCLGATLAVRPASAQYQGDAGAQMPKAGSKGTGKTGAKGHNLPAVSQPIYGAGHVGGYEDLPKAGFGQTYIKPKRLVTAKRSADKPDAAKAADNDAQPSDEAPPKKKRLKTIYRDGVRRPAHHGSLLSVPTPEE